MAKKRVDQPDPNEVLRPGGMVLSEYHRQLEEYEREHRPRMTSSRRKRKAGKKKGK